MNQPDFQAMSQKELQRYVLSHREDQTAFYAYVDKLNTEANWIEMPPLSSVEGINNHPEFVNRFRNNSQRN
ncbi:MAG: hypothetical protein KA717_33870 [Woronichinia naegeliana WA131]|jgi:hypothetical protein|uniref:Uncharacterized protein n=1 Tax=Woronichinia naegeliana WA131 TaxID=2824559 RepID=A0A977KV55_9CYAN|nr:MAG: hypothetical protein KA717_33870 [Woronichinia naegeliana WA131]